MLNNSNQSRWGWEEQRISLPLPNDLFCSLQPSKVPKPLKPMSYLSQGLYRTPP